MPLSLSADPTDCSGFDKLFVAGICITQTGLLGAVVSPYSPNGKVKGALLFRITPDSLLAKRGFRNGDALIQLNGKNIIDLKLADIKSELEQSEPQKKCKALVRRLASMEEVDCTLDNNA